MRPRFGFRSVVVFVGVLLCGQGGIFPGIAFGAERLVDGRAFAPRIDELVAARWTEEGVKPAPAADDAKFLRRVTLDIAGRIPRVSEIHAFLADPAPDKRARAVDRLLEGADYPRHFARVWADRLLGDTTSPQAAFGGAQLEAWLRKQFIDDVPYDRMVNKLLSVPALQGFRGRAFDPNDAAPYGWYQALELKAEAISGTTARLFMGVNLDCAQCHDHPTAHWRREQFWELTAFFTDIAPVRRGAPPPSRTEARTRPTASIGRSVLIPNTDTLIAAKFLDGSDPAFEPDSHGRTLLANWLTRAQNPWFARAAVNYAWAHFFGTGLIEPLDDPSDKNPPSHPELLEELAEAFADSGFDQRFLVRAITSSRAYALSSNATGPAAERPRLFARAPVRGMTANQLFDSIAMATGYREGQNPYSQRLSTVYAAASPRGQFLARFGGQLDRPTESQTTILQALTMMNGSLVADATSLQRSEALAAIADAPFLDIAGQVEALFLATLSRPPRPEEAARFGEYVVLGGASKDSKRALGDVMWVLLNSSEFRVNHSMG